MKKLIQVVIIVFIAKTINGQVLTNLSCDMAIEACGDGASQIIPEIEGCNSFWGTLPHLFYKFSKIDDQTDASLSILDQTTSSNNTNYKIYGPFVNQNYLSICSQIQGNLVSPMFQGSFSGSGHNQSGIIPGGTYIVEVVPKHCFGGDVGISFSNASGIVCNPPPPCDNCIPSFSPKPGSYVISAWVKQDNANSIITTYTRPKIEISFVGNSANYTFSPSGQIIDGWQKIESIFEIPANATDINLDFISTQGDVYFDDIRFSPAEGSMMSYVYDPITMRLMAELDERNYATLYEYDEEGKLIRVKKETEKGIMTIQENRDNSAK